MSVSRPRRVGDELERVRSRVFVGRDAELGLFRQALDEDPPAALFFHGPAGIGKTELLRAIEREARRGGRVPVRISSREVPPSPEALVAALAMMAHAAPSISVEELGEHLRASRAVVLIDGFEQMQVIEWFVGSVLHRAVSPGASLVIAGRLPPDAARWQVAPRPTRLSPFSREVSLQLLERHGIPAARRAGLHRITRGHPLALSLAARLGAEAEETRELADLALVQALLDRVLDTVPSPVHGQALRLAGLVVHVRPELLARLDAGRAPELFQWLRDLSFVEESPLGLAVHDVVRDALAANLQWRSPTSFRRLRALLREHVLDEAREGRWREKPHLFHETLHALQHFPAARILFEESTDIHRALAAPPALPSPARPEELPLIEAALERFEGRRAVELWAHWHQRGAQTVVAHDGTGAAIGFATIVWLDTAADADVAFDDGIHGLHRQLETQRRTGRVFLVRFWGSFERHHAPSEARPVLFQWLTSQNLVLDGVRAAFSFDADPDRAARETQAWRAHRRFPEHDYVLEGKRYGCIGTIFVESASEMVLRSFEALTREEDESAATMGPKQLAAEVKRALKNVDRIDLLAKSALLRTALVPPGGDPGARAEALATILRTECEALHGDPGLYRVLDRTFLRPAPKEYAAALELGLAYATYRRHLAKAIEHIAESLRARM